MATREDISQGEILREFLKNPDLKDTTIMEYLANGMKDGFLERGLDATEGVIDSNYDEYDYTRFFSMANPIPFSYFEGIRKSVREVRLTQTQEDNVMKAFDALINDDKRNSPSRSELIRRVSDPLPFVSVFFDQLCPQLASPNKSGPRPGATYLLLSAITGHKGLCTRCLDAGANPNNMSFLMEEKHSSDEMFHGYSPLFIAILAEQFEVMEELSQYGGSIHVYDRWGRTPLHAAVAMENKDLVQWLLAKGAPRLVSDSYNYQPGDCASFSFASSKVVMDHLLVPLTQRKDPTPVEERPKCHCLSGLPSGYCGCVDDMYLRWSHDRHNTKWGLGVNFASLAELQKRKQEEKQAAAIRAKR